MAFKYYGARTSGNKSVSGFGIYGGAGTINAAITDNNDATYVAKNASVNGNFTFTQYFGNPSVSMPPAGEFIYKVEARARTNSSSSSNSYSLTLSPDTTYGGNVTQNYGGIFIASSGLAITTVSRTTSTITATTSGTHGLAAGDLIYVTSTNGTPAGFAAGTFAIVTTPTTTTFTAIDITGASNTSSVAGTGSLYRYNIGANLTLNALPYATGANAAAYINDLTMTFGDASPKSTPVSFYEASLLVTTATLPTVSITSIDGDSSAPYTVTTTSQPTIVWSYTQAESLVQQLYRLKVYTAPQADPDNGNAAQLFYDSGTTSSSANSATIANLQNGVSYYAYVKAAAIQTTRIGIGTSLPADEGWSTWASLTFSVALTSPTAPRLTASWDTVTQRTTITATGAAVTAPMTAQTFDIQRSDDGGTTWVYVRGAQAQIPNGSFVVTAYDYEPKRGVTVRYRARSVATGAGNTIASSWNSYVAWTFEVDTTGWTAGANTTLSQSTTQKYDGAYSLRLAPTAAGTVSATAGSLTLTPVVVGGSYTASAWLRSTSASRTATVSIAWYTAAAALISTSAGSGTTITTSAFTQASVVATAPATAAYAVVSISVAATGSAADFQYVDGVEFYATNTTVAIPAVTTWNLRALDTGGQVALASDVKVLSDLDLTQGEDQGVFLPLGRSTTLVVHGTVRGEDGSYSILCPSQAAFDSLLAVMNARAVVLVMDPFGEQKYVRVTGRSYKKTGAAASPRYYVTMNYVEADSGLIAG
jgi:hypothetical protein